MNEDIEKNLRMKISYLEAKVDLLESELCNINELVVNVGFRNGIAGLKSTIQQVLDAEKEF